MQHSRYKERQLHAQLSTDTAFVMSAFRTPAGKGAAMRKIGTHLMTGTCRAYPASKVCTCELGSVALQQVQLHVESRRMFDLDLDQPRCNACLGFIWECTGIGTCCGSYVPWGTIDEDKSSLVSL